MARPMVALRQRPVLDRLSTDPAHRAFFDRGVGGSGVFCDGFGACCLVGFDLSTGSRETVRLGAVGRIARRALLGSTAPASPAASTSATAAIGGRTSVCCRCRCSHVGDMQIVSMRERRWMADFEIAGSKKRDWE